jgi:tetratricopeptide (TPR) repeat protein
MRAFVAAIAVATLVVLGAADAHADPDRSDALGELQRGVAAFRAGDYDDALRAFEAAQRLAPDKPNPYRWLALTQVQLGDCPAAVRNIEGFLARVAPDEPRVAELQRLRELCQQTGILRVGSTPPQAALLIDGARAGTTPYTSLSMRAGEHTVEVSKSGYRSQSRTFTMTPGGEHALTLQLQREARPITRRWWFWTAVGVVTAAAATGAVLVLMEDPSATMLPGVLCTPAQGCQ